MWYIQKNGRTEGPISDATIAHAIGKGDLGPFDLVFRDGESRWQVLSEIPQFASLFAVRPKASPAEEATWVVLTKTDESKTRRQKGPYKTSEIVKMLSSGEVLLSDYVWKEGMREWYRIHSLELFHRPTTAESVAPTAEVPAVQAHSNELLKSVKVMERPGLPLPESVPPEAVVTTAKVSHGPEITKTNARLEPLVTARPAGTTKPKIRSVKGRESTAVTRARRLSFYDRLRLLPWPRRALTRLFAFVSIGALALGLLYFFSYHDWQTLLKKQKAAIMAEVRGSISAKVTPKIEAAPAPTPAPAPAPQVAESVPPKPVAPAPEPVVAPTSLRLRVLQGQTPNAQLDIQTNASKHFTVRLRITGEAGRVIGARSFYRETKVKSDNRKLSIESLNLPAGYFTVVAQVGDFEDEVSLSWRLFDKNFKGDFSEHRKSIVHFATQERYYLIRGAEYLEAKATDLIERVTRAPKSVAYKEWSKSLQRVPGPYLRTITGRNRSDYVYAGDWLKLRELQRSLGEAAKAFLAAPDKNAPEASLALRQIVLELQRQKEAALQASLWR